MEGPHERRHQVNTPSSRSLPPAPIKAIQGLYDQGYRRGFMAGVRAACLDGPKACGGERLYRLMQVPDNVARDPKRSVNTLRGEWQYEDCFIVCAGPSLQEFDWKKLSGKRVIGVNRVALLAPIDVDFLLVNDLHLWERYEKAIAEWDPSIRLVSQPSAFFEYKLAELQECIWYEPMDDLDKCFSSPDALYMHHTVAAAAIYFAWLLGAKRIFVLGLDGYVTEERSYFWDETINGQRLRGVSDGVLVDEKMSHWNQNLNALRDHFVAHNSFKNEWPDSGVYNLSPKSQIEAWPKLEATEVFADDRRTTESESELPQTGPDNTGQDRDIPRGSEVLRGGDSEASGGTV